MKNMTLLVAMILSVFLTQSAQAACPSQFASLPLAERCQKAKDALEYGRITQPEINDCCEPPKAQAHYTHEGKRSDEQIARVQRPGAALNRRGEWVSATTSAIFSDAPGPRGFRS